MSNASVVAQLTACALGGRLDQLPDIMHPQFELVEPVSLPWGGAYCGPAGYSAFLTRLGEHVEPSELEVQATYESGDAVVQKSALRFTNPETGASLSTSVVEIYTVREGKLERCEVFFEDTAALVAICTEPPQ